MDYNEGRDLAEHKTDIDNMFAMLAAHGQSMPADALVLDVGGGAGMHAGMLAPHVRKILCTDYFDQHVRFNGEFIRLLREKFERNDYAFNSDAFEFHAVDAMSLVYRDNLFDMVVSFNAMEHIPEPTLALAEIHRVLKPGALAYITFDPIWTCDTGSHFSHRVPAPWSHVVMDDDAFVAALHAAGGDDKEAGEYRTAMNRKRLAHYREAFDAMRDRFDFLAEYEWSGTVQPEHPQHPNFARARAMGYSEDELLFRGMSKLLRKR